jgi:hypothetical protein
MHVFLPLEPTAASVSLGSEQPFAAMRLDVCFAYSVPSAL